MEAYCIGLVVSFYDAPIVLQAVLITLGIFVGLTLFACQSKYDFTGWQPWLFGLLTGVVIFGFVSMFFPRNNTVELFYSAAVAILFSAYIVSYIPCLILLGVVGVEVEFVLLTEVGECCSWSTLSSS